MNAIPDSGLLWTGELAVIAGVTRKTVLVWIKHGVLVAGRRIKLQAQRIGAYYKSDRERLDAFLAACDGQAPPPEPPRGEAKRRRDVERVKEQLRAKGLMSV